MQEMGSFVRVYERRAVPSRAGAFVPSQEGMNAGDEIVRARVSTIAARIAAAP